MCPIDLECRHWSARTALDAARAAIGLTALVYTDATINPSVTTVKALHFMQLRAGTQ